MPILKDPKDITNSGSGSIYIPSRSRQVDIAAFSLDKQIVKHIYCSPVEPVPFI
jgi:hypothetical protein